MRPGCATAISECDAAAERGADERRALDRVAVHRGEDILGVAEVAGLERRAPEAAQIEPQHAQLARERLPERVPHPRIADAGVDQNHSRTGARDLDV